MLVYCLIKKDPSILRVERGRGGVLTEGEGGGDGHLGFDRWAGKT